MDVERASEAWALLEAAVGPISGVHSRANAEVMMSRVDTLLDWARSGSITPAGQRLLAFLTTWIENYEQVHCEASDVDPIDLLKFLMSSNGLKQRDLAGLLGGQSCVSAILNRKREINRRQALALGRRFSLSPAVFLQESADSPDVVPVAKRVSDTTGAPLQLRVQATTQTASGSSTKTYEPSYHLN